MLPIVFHDPFREVNNPKRLPYGSLTSTYITDDVHIVVRLIFQLSNELHLNHVEDVENFSKSEMVIVAKYVMIARCIRITLFTVVPFSHPHPQPQYQHIGGRPHVKFVFSLLLFVWIPQNGQCYCKDRCK